MNPFNLVFPFDSNRQVRCFSGWTWGGWSIGKGERGERTVAILIQAGNNNRGSSDPPERYSTQLVMYAFKAFMVRSRTRVACGV
jgi:hypothetical protein